jgi:2-alkenal reductase
MNRKQRKLVLSLFSILLFLALACQVANNPETFISSEINPDTEAIVDEAVATVIAQAPDLSEIAIAGQNTPSQLSSDLEGQLIEIYDRVNPSVVHIFVYDENQIIGSGSGFVFDKGGHIVTNNHVLEGGGEYEVVFSDGDRRYGRVVGTDVDSDLAIIQINDQPEYAAPIPLGDSGSLRVGQFVIAIGNPFGEESSMSIGIVSGLGRTLESQRVVAGGYFSIPQIIQTDAAINPGNSGGPLLNLTGEVIGVNSAILSRTGANSGVGYSIPVNAVRNIAPALVEEGQYHYPYLGISMRTEPFNLRELEELKLPPNGVWVLDVGEGTPADEAGLIGHNLSVDFVPDGDYIIAIDDNPVRNSDELLSYLVFETSVGDTVSLTVIRNGEEVNVPLTLGERP